MSGPCSSTGFSSWDSQRWHWQPTQGEGSPAAAQAHAQGSCTCSELSVPLSRQRRYPEVLHPVAHSPPSEAPPEPPAIPPACSRVGNALGAARAAAGKLAALAAAIAAPLVWLVVAAVLVTPACQRLLLGLFASSVPDELLMQRMRNLLYIVVALELFDGAQTGACLARWGRAEPALRQGLAALGDLGGRQRSVVGRCGPVGGWAAQGALHLPFQVPRAPQAEQRLRPQLSLTPAPRTLRGPNAHWPLRPRRAMQISCSHVGRGLRRRQAGQG